MILVIVNIEIHGAAWEKARKRVKDLGLGLDLLVLKGDKKDENSN